MTDLSRREFIKTLGAGLSASLVPSVESADDLPEGSPNIVVIFTDDQGYADVGCYGAEGLTTPNLDRMADEGMRFTDFYVAAPVCTPSRAALLTGCYPKRLGLAYRVLFPYSNGGLNPDEITIAELLKGRGYTTACIGKWHLGHHEKFYPTRQGFDYFFGAPYSNDMNGHYYRQHYYQSQPLPLMRNEETIEQNPDQRFLTKRYTEEAQQFIRNNKDRPFFVYLPHAMPHMPIHVSPGFAGSSEMGLYGDVIQEIDWSVGQIMETLSELDLDRSTLVVFTSDNGPWHKGSAKPLRGKKNTTWEGGMREPCIMRWTGRIPAGSVCTELATAMDLLPTIAHLTGAKVPGDRIIDGRSIWPLMSGQDDVRTPHEAFFYYRDNRLQAVRSGRWKLHTYRPEWGDDSAHAPLLYDLETDIGETTDVAGRQPEVVKRLMRLAENARRDMGDAVTGDKGENVRPVGRL
ncbi:sulfatase [Candidatus Latescibacterota bacterium]